MQLNRGQRLRLSDITPSATLRVSIMLQGVQADIACFGLDAAGQLSDERYMTFYNQAASPCGGVVLANAGASSATAFDLILDRLPPSIERLVFTAALDAPGVMRDRKSVV